MNDWWLRGYLAGVVSARRNALEGAPVAALTYALAEIDALSEAVAAMDDDFVAAGRAEIARMRDLMASTER